MAVSCLFSYPVNLLTSSPANWLTIFRDTRDEFSFILHLAHYPSSYFDRGEEECYNIRDFQGKDSPGIYFRLNYYYYLVDYKNKSGGKDIFYFMIEGLKCANLKGVIGYIGIFKNK